MDKVELKLDWATYEAAKYACERWHYSKCLPGCDSVKIGVWENGIYIGIVLFSRGANNHIGTPYNLKDVECAELTRVALNKHISAVTKIVAISIKMLKRYCSGLRLIVSYADPEQGHVGSIYQAGGWFYVGTSQAQREVIFNGKIMHKRTANSLFGTIKGMQKSPIFYKYKYLMPLDDAMRKQIEPLRKPYPKRPKVAGPEVPPPAGPCNSDPDAPTLTEDKHASARVP